MVSAEGLAGSRRRAPQALKARLVQVCGLQAAELVVVLGDAHVYSNHVQPLQTQLAQQPFPFPVRRLQSCMPRPRHMHGVMSTSPGAGKESVPAASKETRCSWSFRDHVSVTVCCSCET